MLNYKFEVITEMAILFFGKTYIFSLLFLT